MSRIVDQIRSGDKKPSPKKGRCERNALRGFVPKLFLSSTPHRGITFSTLSFPFMITIQSSSYFTRYLKIIFPSKYHKMAASYQCSGSVKTRSLCTEKQIASIQREQFKELPREEALNYHEMMRQVDKSFDGGDTEEDEKEREINCMKPLGSQARYAHTVYDYQSILRQEPLPNKQGRFEMWALSAHILDEYVRELVRYANDRRHTAGKRKGRSRSPEPFEDRTAVKYRVRAREDVQKSCVMFTGDDFEDWGYLPHMARKRVAGDFRARNLEGQKFMNLDYVLIPYWRGMAHHILLGMAPKQKVIIQIRTPQ